MKRRSAPWWKPTPAGSTSAAAAMCFPPIRPPGRCWPAVAAYWSGWIPATTSRRTRCCTSVFGVPSSSIAQIGCTDLITMRMVAEHIATPEATVAALAELLRSGGHVILYTVRKWSPAAVAAALTPMAVHHSVKRVLWDTAERDTFPTYYRMNTRATLRRLFEANGFIEEIVPSPRRHTQLRQVEVAGHHGTGIVASAAFGRRGVSGGVHYGYLSQEASPPGALPPGPPPKAKPLESHT